MKFDLHTHSTASDGSLHPAQLWEQAQTLGLDYFAVTDHDTVAGYEQLQSSSVVLQQTATRLVSGVEMSAQYNGRCVHIVALDFDSQHPRMQALLESTQNVRADRAKKIAALLEKHLGREHVLQDVLTLHDHQIDVSQLTRPHFAQYLLETGVVRKFDHAFKHWLAQGKKAFANTEWLSMESVVADIIASGGVAVLAHPLKYGMTRTRMRLLVESFVEAGGKALELCCPQQTVNDTRFVQRLIEKHDLYASGGSDFHNPNQSWTALGKVPNMPASIKPIWELFRS